MEEEREVRVFHFRGGPIDGRRLPIPVTENREWPIPTVDGVWPGDRGDPLPQDLSTVDYRYEKYLLVDDEYVHESLVTPEDDPPESWLRTGWEAVAPAALYTYEVEIREGAELNTAATFPLTGPPERRFTFESDRPLRPGAVFEHDGRSWQVKASSVPDDRPLTGELIVRELVDRGDG